MKVEVEGHEIVDAKISKVSLVKRGANRAPFKILKSEDVEEAPTQESFLKRLMGIFQKSEPAKESEGQVVGLFVNESALETAKPILEKAGFKLENPIAKDGVLFFKHGDAKEVDAVVALNDHVGVAVTGIKKYMQPHAGSTSFYENLGVCGFYPSVNMATEAMWTTFYRVLDNARTPEEASDNLKTALKEFSSYVVSLVNALPTVVFKTEKELTVGFVSNKLPSESLSKVEEIVKMRKVVEAMAGDLDGLMNPSQVKKDAEAMAADEAALRTKIGDTKTDEVKKDEPTQEAPKTEAPVTPTQTEVKPEATVEKTMKYGKKMRKTAEGLQEWEYSFEEHDGQEVFVDWVKKVEKAVEAPKTETQEAAVQKTEVQLTVPAELTDLLKSLNDKLDAQAAEIATLKKSAEKPAEPKPQVRVVRDNADLSQTLATPGGQPSRVAKAEVKEDVWKGTGLDIFDRRQS